MVSTPEISRQAERETPAVLDDPVEMPRINRAMSGYPPSWMRQAADPRPRRHRTSPSGPVHRLHRAVCPTTSTSTGAGSKAQPEQRQADALGHPRARSRQHGDHGLLQRLLLHARAPARSQRDSKCVRRLRCRNAVRSEHGEEHRGTALGAWKEKTGPDGKLVGEMAIEIGDAIFMGMGRTGP